VAKGIGIARSAGVVGFFTLLSRILGLVRDMVFAHIFGSGFVADAFFVAFRIPNLLRKLFAEGSLTAAFVPVFSDYLVQKGKKEAFQLSNRVLSCLLIVLVFVTLLGILLSPLIVKISAYGFTSVPDKFNLTVILTRIMFPYILLISIVAFFMGVLNTFGHFAAPAAAPILLNAFIIICAVYLSPLLKTPIIGVGIGVILGGIAQVLLQIPFVKGFGFNFSFEPVFKDEGVKRIGKLALPTLFGAAVYQLNQVIGTLLASFLEEGSVSWLYYADRLVQFPLGIFGVAMGTVSLASLSRHAANNDWATYNKTLAQAMGLLIFTSVPATFGLLVLGEPIVRLFFERGRFTHYDTLMTNKALWAYGVGLLAYSQIRVLVSAFFALKDTRTPVYVATFALVLNFLAGIILMRPFGHTGLALALSIASFAQAAILYYLLEKKTKGNLSYALSKSMIKSIMCSIGMAAIVYLGKSFLFVSVSGFTALMTKLLALVVLGALVYVFLAFLFRVEELKLLRIIGG